MQKTLTILMCLLAAALFVPPAHATPPLPPTDPLTSCQVIWHGEVTFDYDAGDGWVELEWIDGCAYVSTYVFWNQPSADKWVYKVTRVLNIIEDSGNETEG